MATPQPSEAEEGISSHLSEEEGISRKVCPGAGPTPGPHQRPPRPPSMCMRWCVPSTGKDTALSITTTGTPGLARHLASPLPQPGHIH